MLKVDRAENDVDAMYFFFFFDSTSRHPFEIHHTATDVCKETQIRVSVIRDQSSILATNSMPSSSKQLLSAMNVENLFVKKAKVCILRHHEVRTAPNLCN